MIVGVEDEADGLVGGALDFGEDLLGAPGVVGVDHEDVILEDDPAAVGGFDSDRDRPASRRHPEPVLSRGRTG